MASQDWILAGVSGSAGSKAAVRYAAHEAARTGAALRVVHVVPTYASFESLNRSSVRVTADELATIGDTILQEAMREAQWYLAEDRVDGQLVTGDRASGLLAAGRGASALVLGQDSASNMARITTGSLIASVAGRAQAPVVTVPDDWAPSEPRGQVAVGLKNLGAIPARLVTGALQLAVRSSAHVEIVHVWSPPAHYVEDTDAAAMPPGGAEAASQDVQHRIAGVCAGFPALHVAVRVTMGDPSLVLCEASERADLLVIARRAKRLPSGHFGSTGRAVLRGARCPIVVLPIAEEPAPDDVASAALTALVRH